MTGIWYYKGLVNKLPFYAPILWLAYYATKRRSEYQRLEQEYAHKESLAKSYNNYHCCPVNFLKNTKDA